MKYRSKEGDTVDSICYRFFKQTRDITETVLKLNPSISKYGPLLPSGLVIELPDTAPQKTTQTINLWN